MLRAWILGILSFGGLLYAVDFAVFQVRNVYGGATAMITVSQFVATPLKGNKVEYDYLGPSNVQCAQAIFPHQGMPACWYLGQNKDHWQ
jgi:hypothetical protein